MHPGSPHGWATRAGGFALLLAFVIASKLLFRFLFNSVSIEEMGVIVGALIVGGLSGALPRHLARKRGHNRLGNVAFGASIGAGLVGGLVLAVPTAAVFTVIGLRRPQLDAAVTSTAANLATAPAPQENPSGALLPVTGGTTYGNKSAA